MALSISVKGEKADKIVQNAKIKAVKNKISLSEVVIKLLDKWSKGDIEIDSSKHN
jgi:hypothetical protein